jgi:hypothetical protein
MKTKQAPALSEGRLSIKTRFTLFFIFFLIMIFSLMLILSTRHVFEVTSLVNTRMGLPTVERIAAIIDGDAFEKLSRTLDAGDPYYQKTQLAMRKIWQETGCLYLFTMARETQTPHKKNIYRFIIDSSANPGDKGFSALGD